MTEMKEGKKQQQKKYYRLCSYALFTFVCVLCLPQFSFSSVQLFDAHPAFSRHVIKSAPCSAKFQKKATKKGSTWIKTNCFLNFMACLIRVPHA